MALNVTATTGRLDAVVAAWRYADDSGIHGLALAGREGEGGDLLYSADLSGDAIWTHRLCADGGVEVAGRFEVESGSHPRHIAVHPGRGRRVYVVMEAGNRVVEYGLDGGGVVEREEGRRWGLIPDGEF